MSHLTARTSIRTFLNAAPVATTVYKPSSYVSFHTGDDQAASDAALLLGLKGLRYDVHKTNGVWHFSAFLRKNHA